MFWELVVVLYYTENWVHRLELGRGFKETSGFRENIQNWHLYFGVQMKMRILWCCILSSLHQRVIEKESADAVSTPHFSAGLILYIFKLFLFHVAFISSPSQELSTLLIAPARHQADINPTTNQPQETCWTDSNPLVESRWSGPAILNSGCKSPLFFHCPKIPPLEIRDTRPNTIQLRELIPFAAHVPKSPQTLHNNSLQNHAISVIWHYNCFGQGTGTKELF